MEVVSVKNNRGFLYSGDRPMERARPLKLI